MRETVAILKQADVNPLDVSGYGTLDERLASKQISRSEAYLPWLDFDARYVGEHVVAGHRYVCIIR